MTTNNDITTELLQKIAERFEFHGKNIYGSSSPENSSSLYARLAIESSKSPEILSLVAHADFSTQLSNLLFGAVQYLLLNRVKHPLSGYYPNMNENPLPIADAFPYFHDFCLQHAGAIQELVNNRRIQTNEVGRCTALVPVFNLVFNRVHQKPLALLEIGASAGLLLHWDKYAYSYQGLAQTGKVDSPVHLICEMKGSIRPTIPQEFPPVNERIGLEYEPIDVYDEQATAWLEALIWPEHHDRRKLLREALNIAQENPLTIVAGNAAATLGDSLQSMPADATLCILHSYVFAQMPITIRETILAQLLEFSKQRSFFRISQEWLAGWEKPRIELFSYHQGEMQPELLAYAESHGRWLEWL